MYIYVYNQLWKSLSQQWRLDIPLKVICKQSNIFSLKVYGRCDLVDAKMVLVPLIIICILSLTMKNRTSKSMYSLRGSNATANEWQWRICALFYLFCTYKRVFFTEQGTVFGVPIVYLDIVHVTRAAWFLDIKLFKRDSDILVIPCCDSPDACNIWMITVRVVGTGNNAMLTPEICSTVWVGKDNR